MWLMESVCEQLMLRFRLNERYYKLSTLTLYYACFDHERYLQYDHLGSSLDSPYTPLPRT
jgi:hypothetical protein